MEEGWGGPQAAPKAADTNEKEGLVAVGNGKEAVAGDEPLLLSSHDDEEGRAREAEGEEDGLMLKHGRGGGGGGGGEEEEGGQAPRLFETEQPRLTNVRMCGLTLLWFSRSAWWAAFSILLLPLQVLNIVGDQYKGSALGAITLGGAVVSLVAYPIVGILSDRTQSRKHSRFLPAGRRMPYVVVGVPLMAGSMIAFPFLSHHGAEWMFPYGAAHIALSLFDAVASAPYLALVPDIVAQEQFGAMSGWLGLMNMLGNLVGGLLGAGLDTLTDYGTIAFLAALQFVCLSVTLVSVNEPQEVLELSPASMDDSFEPATPFYRLRALLDWIAEALRPFKDPNFRWVFWTRFLFTAGFQVITQFLQFFMRDAVSHPYVFLWFLKIDTTGAAVSFFIVTVTIGAIISSLLSGHLSDRFGRKPVIYLAGTAMAVIPLIIIFSSDFTVMPIAGLFFGLAYGGYITVDFALVSDVLPRSESHATDLGVWHISWVFPTVITPPIAGLMVDLLDPLSDSFNVSHLGYKSIFFLASLLLLLAVVFVRRIQITAKAQPQEGLSGIVEEMEEAEMEGIK